MDLNEPHKQTEAAEDDDMFLSDIELSYGYDFQTDQPLSVLQRLINLAKSLMQRNFGFVVAIFVVIVGQFRGPIFRWLRRMRQDKVSFSDAVLHLWWMTADYLRGSWQMWKEVLRTLTAAVPPEVEYTPARRTEQASRSRSSNRSNVLPELEELSPNDGESGATRQQTPWCEVELAPAFLSDKDYPPGWMVYHPILGVEAKTVADQHDRQQLLLSTKTIASAEEKRRKATSLIDEDYYDSDSSVDEMPEIQSTATGTDVHVLRSIAASG